MGWFSKIEQPLVRDASIWVWRQFCDLNLAEAQKTRFNSMHDCFIRTLKPGARSVDADPAVLASPCDAIVGACGQVQGTTVFQAKGFPYQLEDLLADAESVDACRNGTYVTLRLTAGMYHRFHAPCDLTVERVNYLSGDTWNVNPIALKRVERLFCKNERATLRTRLPGGQILTLVPVAAVLVASIRLHFLDVLLHLRYRGPNVMHCHAPCRKGQEMGWFEHGSTIIVFAPPGFALCAGIQEGTPVRMGQALLRQPDMGNPPPPC
jgi:phosphatidylserine decarboxylase